ncbi:MAG: hypothetical protein RLZZ440_2544 [Planctomycetota bacterium]
MPGSSIAVAVLAASGIATVAVLVRTKWLESRTLEKCVALSVGLHAALGIMAVFIGGWSPASWGQRDEGRMTMLVVLADDATEEEAVADAAERLGGSDEPLTDAAEVPDALAALEPPSLVPLAAAEPSPAPPDLVPLLESPIEEPSSEPTDALGDGLAHDAPSPEAGAVDAGAAANPPAKPIRPAVPPAYADRIGERRMAAAAARGGTADTERAVQAALGWLARNQSSDGRWSAAQYGAGSGATAQHAAAVGARSDHGVTGLALLAFLGAGTTHRDGPHAAEVAKGLSLLARTQRADGSLAGDAEFFAALYCHGMAAIAVAECYALTGDESLRPVLDRAVAYTLALQHPHTGGWRYAAGDRGDTSQLGWQVMLLASCRNAGLAGLDAAEARARGFLQTVASGSAGGLAAYRPGERPSVAMTAEAIFCRMLLGLPPDHPAAAEALGLVAHAPPTAASYNSYTWYYATLASFHAGGPQWDAWNGRLQAALLPLQHRAGGPLDGSWDPDRVWGGHGGRVYATALSALTLEVYYRHLPLHDRAWRMASRTGP